MKKQEYSTFLPQLSPIIFLGVDYLKKGDYTLHITNKEKIISSLKIRKE